MLLSLSSGWLSPHVPDGAIYQEERFDHIRGSHRSGSTIYKDVPVVHRSKSNFQSGPAMTWGMHAIGHLELGQEEAAARMFDKSYLPYVQVPIKPSNPTLRIKFSMGNPCVVWLWFEIGIWPTPSPPSPPST